MAIKNVAVAGGTGALGRPIVDELVKAGFAVTLLTRVGSTSTPPEGIVATKAVDYASVADLTAALVGQDAVVSVLGSQAAGQGVQRPLAEAATAPGSSIRRFIPSEFGLNTRKTRASTSPLSKLLAPKAELVDYLAAHESDTFSWTALGTGHFFDWALTHDFYPVDPVRKTATIFDSGNERFQASNLAFVGRAVAAVLHQAETADDAKTRNKFIEVASFTPTQNEVLAAVQRLTGTAPADWTITKVDTATLLEQATAQLAAGNPAAFAGLLSVWQFGDGAGHAPDLTDPASGNQLLGLAPEDVEATLAAWLKK